MSTKYKLIAMAFDGETQESSFEFDSIDAAWSYSDDFARLWYFYPFHFVTTQSGKTIRDVPDFVGCFDFAKGKRVKTVAKMFKAESEIEENQELDSEAFSFSLDIAYNNL